MSKAIWVLLALGAGGAAAAVHLKAQLREARAENAQLQARVAELERDAPPPTPFAREAAPGASPAEAAAPSASPPAPTSRVAAAAIVAPAAGVYGFAPFPNREEAMRQMRAQRERERALLNDPEYRDAMLFQHKTMLSQQYPDLAEALQLSAEELDRFFSLLADQQLRSRDIYLPMDPSSTPEELADAANRTQAWDKTVQAELKAELGADKWRAWQEYQSTMGVRYQVRELNQTLAAQGAALDPTQLTMLRQALVAAEKQHMQAMNQDASRMHTFAGAPRPAQQAEWLERSLQMQKEHHRRVRDAASTVLNSEQLQVLEDKQRAQLKLQEAHVKMARAQADAEARGETSSSSAMFVSGESLMLSESGIVAAD